MFNWRKKKCSECGGELDQTTVSRCRGSYLGVEVEFSNMPVLSCGRQGHPIRYADPGFGASLMDAMYRSNTFPITHSAIKGIHKCFRCKNRIPYYTSGYMGIVGGITIEGLPEFTMSISATGVFCEACGAEQIWADDEVSEKINEAIVVAFTDINLSP